MLTGAGCRILGALNQAMRLNRTQRDHRADFFLVRAVRINPPENTAKAVAGFGLLLLRKNGAKIRASGERLGAEKRRTSRTSRNNEYRSKR